jgi:predicted CXXCH cytochrome family protein
MRPALLRHLLIILLLLPAALLPVRGESARAAGKNCFKCHDAKDFAGRIKHQPFARGDCAACHSTHASRYPGLLTRPADKLCSGCHEKFYAGQQRYAYQHEPVTRGECSACHDPHAADNRKLMRRKPGSECYDCHRQEKEKKFKFKHQPFARGQCYACHVPHGADNPRLLRRASPGICFKCHAPGPGLNRRHLGREMKRSDCLKCHNPHGSDRQELLRRRRHPPFDQGKCSTCHPAGGKPAQSHCLKCHPAVPRTFLAPHNHLGPLEEDGFCLSCHNPHAADQADLPSGRPGSACEKCHADKFKRRARMLYGHPGNRLCADCHQVHGSPRQAMLKNGAAEVCNSCHKRHAKFTHPVGEKALDPRNHEPMNCITCHDPCNGTMHRFNLRGDAKRGLCVQCHRNY